MKNIVILGSNGSVGRQTISVALENKNINILGISVSFNFEDNIKIIDICNPRYVCLRNNKLLSKYKEKFPNIIFKYGKKNLSFLTSLKYENNQVHIVNALPGIFGIESSINTIKNDNILLLANKETFVVAGALINSLLSKHKTSYIIPLDSEHSSLYRLLGNANFKPSTYSITASGGALRDYTSIDKESVTFSDIMRHPTWVMGPKITLDSTTLLNKGFEVIEAHHLFNIDFENIDVYFQRESMVHSFITNDKNESLYYISYPSMEEPIRYALNYPTTKFDTSCIFNSNSKHILTKMDITKYELVQLSYYVGKKGGLLPCVLVASSEATYSLFKDNIIKYNQISEIIIQIVKKYDNIIDSVNIKNINLLSKKIINEIIRKYT
ncbi:MAG: hypothetical protein LBV51_04255 [Acholeplasmatales bacterium]|jgi:1-deoxy-D-xylulose-5-phosphate reductoisomerase|nr:hypothetical protein [Acholeplasmatales bacterium]